MLTAESQRICQLEVRLSTIRTTGQHHQAVVLVQVMDVDLKAISVTQRARRIEDRGVALGNGEIHGWALLSRSIRGRARKQECQCTCKRQTGIHLRPPRQRPMTLLSQ